MLLVKYAPGALFVCTLLQKHACYALGAGCISNMVLENMPFRIFFQIINGPGPYGPGAYYFFVIFFQIINGPGP